MNPLALLLALFIGESYRTEVIFLEGLSAERAITIHERLLGQVGESAIVLGRQPNVVVVKDTPLRLSRFREILALLDRPGAAERRIYIRPVRHLAPSELARLVAEVIDQGGDAAEAVQLVPDDRGRQLVVMCRERTYRSLDRLMRKLDVGSTNPREIRVTPAPADSKPGEFPP